MTDITVREKDNLYLIQAKGHATGSEKVCSGISAIMYSLAGWLENNEEHIRYKSHKLTSGDAVIEFKGTDEIARAVFDMAVIGLLQIEQKYPDFIKIKKI